MNQPPPLTPLFRDQRKVDADHLNLLSIFHFVGAGLALIALGFLALHFFLFHTVMSNPQIWEHQNHPPPPEFFAIFDVLYISFGAWFTVSAILNVLSGIFLRSRKHRAFSFVVAGINCLHIPLGTTLAVFTIIILARDSVRELYESDGHA